MLYTSTYMHHFRKTKRTYTKLNHGDRQVSDCGFCTSARAERIVAENDTVFIVANRVAYDVFEGYRVLEHLLAIPKAHRTSLDDFTDQERLDMMRLMGQYEREGYNVYSRGVNAAARSVAHQHTHLIKLSQKASTFVLFSQKPYLLIEKSPKN